MSCDTERLLQNTDHFTLLCSLKYENIIPCSVYRSQITGITVCIAEIDGPIIYGDFNIVTETCDDDGLPYVVKKLIFTGSKDYPYNNILYLWAMRNFATNINAHTYQQRTCFTMRAAGSEGFLNVMPEYLDHILFPSLKDSAYLTEVHHITGEGNNDGVVYCEIQIGERKSDYIINNVMLKELYPGKCGYNSITIGTTKNFRESTTNEKVKQFHKKFYKSENLTLMITGKIQPDAIFQALLPLEEKIMSTKRKYIFKRHWQTPIKPFKESVDVEVFFPSDKEEYGEVHIAWRGPSTITQLFDYRGCLLLLCYLTRGPLTKEFGKIGKHSFVTSNTSHWSHPYFEIIFKNVPVEQIDQITRQSIYKVLRNVCTDGINIETIKGVIHKIMFDTKNILDNSPHQFIAHRLFNHLIYGNINNLEKRFNSLREWEYLKTKSEKYFLTLLKNNFVNAPMVFIKGKPSLDMYLKLQEEETNVTEQNKSLGKNWLKKKKKELQDAIKEQYEIIPNEKLWKVPMSSIDSITFYHIERYTTETVKQHPKLDVKKLPVFTYLDDIDTNFFFLQVVMDTSFLCPEHKLYIPLLVKVITELSVKRGFQLFPSEKVKDFLFADNIKVQSHKGIDTSGCIPNGMSLTVQAELHNYEKCVQWCKEFLYDTELTADNVKVAITQLLSNNKLREKTIPTILMTTLLYTNDTHWYTDNFLQQYTFLTDVQKRLNTVLGQQEVIAEIKFVWQCLTSPNNMFMYMAVNVNKLTTQFPDVLAPWNTFFSTFLNFEKTKLDITSNSKLRTLPYIVCNGCIMGLGWIDSTYFIQTCPCINDFQHADLAALEVCLTYFRQEEGPIRKEIEVRHMLSDEFNLYMTVDDGYLNFESGPVRNVADAYKTTEFIVNMHLAEDKWNPFLYEKAKLSVIFNYINNVQTIKHVINASLTSCCKNLPHDYDYEMVRRVSAVTIHDMIRVTNQYIVPLFDPEQCKIAIVCNIDKFAKIKEDFQKMQFQFYVFKHVEELRQHFQYWNSI